MWFRPSNASRCSAAFICAAFPCSTQIPTLKDIVLPIPRKTRQMIRNLQDFLGTLAEELTHTISPPDDRPIHAPDDPELALVS